MEVVGSIEDPTVHLHPMKSGMLFIVFCVINTPAPSFHFLSNLFLTLAMVCGMFIYIYHFTESAASLYMVDACNQQPSPFLTTIVFCIIDTPVGYYGIVNRSYIIISGVYFFILPPPPDL